MTDNNSEDIDIDEFTCSISNEEAKKLEEASKSGTHVNPAGDAEFNALDVDYNELPTYPIRPHFDKKILSMRPCTQVFLLSIILISYYINMFKLICFDPCKTDPFRPTSMPIYQTATYINILLYSNFNFNYVFQDLYNLQLHHLEHMITQEVVTQQELH